MSEKQEMIADIITEMRDLGKLDEKSNDMITRSLMGLGLRTLADRLEAAAKRDEKHAVEHATHHAEAVASANCRDCIYNPRGENYEGGNAAAMREALESFVEYSELALQMGMFTHDRLVAITAKARDALSAPPRNYDRFNSVKDAAIAFARERQDAPYPCPDFTFSAWLFATATEQKGGNNGK